MDTTALRNLITANPTDLAVVAAYPAAVRVPRTTVVTYTTVSSGRVWGKDRAKVVLKNLRAAAASQSPLADDAQQAVDLLTGPGFDPTDAESVAAIAAFVTANVITQPESDRVRYVYPDDADVPTVEQVAAERAAMARESTNNPLKDVVRLGYNAATDLLDRRIAGTGAQDPTTQEAAAILALKNLLVGGV